jgi:hypothetical protein
MKHLIVFRRIAKLLALATVAAVLAGALWIGTAAWQAHAQTSNPTIVPNDPNSPQGGPFQCNIANIAVFSSRIHVFCAAKVPNTNIQYFAAPGDSAHMIATNRFLMMLNTAYALGKPVYLYYLDDPANNPAGCNANDCRAIDWMFIVP